MFIRFPDKEGLIGLNPIITPLLGVFGETRQG